MISIPDLYRVYLDFPDVQTDSRSLKSGALFFALKGGNFNGNTFAAQAIAQGAAYAIIDEAPAEGITDKMLLVDDVLKTLQALAKYHREQLKIPVLAITGSNGKTTTKELIHAVLSSSYKTYTTSGNLNNHIGIPLTLLRIRKDAEMAVVEMGANHQKEIEGYCQYTLPTHGLITNTGKAHLEGFGGIEGVRKGKGELYDFLRKNKGTAFVMWDYDYLREMSKGIPHIVKYGTADADVTGNSTPNETFLQVALADGSRIQTQLVGDYNLPNILAAVTVGRYFKVPNEQIKKAIEDYSPSNSRSQLLTVQSNKIILDAYNANPTSMKAAIENFALIPAESKILVLGGMAELGEDSMNEHQQIVELISKFNWKAVLLVGGDFLKINHPFTSLPNATAAKEWLQEHPFSNSYLLVKGSRSMQMEKVL